MSYASDLREELVTRMPKARHCRLAELAGLFEFGGNIGRTLEEEIVIFRAENEGVRNKYFTLLKKTIKIRNDDIFQKESSIFMKGESATEFLQAIKFRADDENRTTSRLLLQEMCCRRAFLRGVFLMTGTLTNPNKGYHFEINCRNTAQAEQIVELMESFSLSPKTVCRQKHEIVYLKESDEISDMLNIMEATVTMMDFENVRVQKALKNQVQREANCVTANIEKMVNAAVRETSDIELIAREVGLDSLPPKLKETALLRLEYPEMPLRELGQLMDPPVGKSGVNHRLRRISMIAESIRK